MSQKYTLVHFFEEQPMSHNFSAREWPLHTTLLDMFTVGSDTDVLQHSLQEIAATTRSLTTKAVSETLFGQNKDVAVTLLSINPGIIELHKRLVGLAEETLIQFDHPEYVADGFIPHASIRDDSKLELGKTYRISNISLVDMYPNNDINRRAIIKTYQFL